MTRITHVHAREVLDSRGNPTVEVEIRLEGGASASAIVPSGASTGAAEARELRDGDPRRYQGLGVSKAVANVREMLGPAILGMDPADQARIDARLLALDGTDDKSRLGANAILGVSLAAAHVAAAAERIPLYRHFHRLWRAHQGAQASGPAPTMKMPLPMTNMISGGLHAGGNLDFQDFLIMPVGASSYSEGLEWIVRVTRRLAEALSRAGYEGRLLADEGGYGPRLKSNRQAIELLMEAIERAALRPGADISIALDVASSHFHREGRYKLVATGYESLTSDQMIDALAELVADFPITSIEDGLAEEDWSGWAELTRRLGNRVWLVGDDLFATNPDRLRKGISLGAANAALIKMNQIGTVSETLTATRIALEANHRRIVSARSGETEDTTIADLAVAVGADSIKIGAVQRGERLAKYNRLTRIEEELTGG